MVRILDGKKESQRLLRALTARVHKYRRPITLATILVGDRFDSALYVKLKRRAAAVVGIKTELHYLPANTNQATLHRLINKLNRRRAIHGILLQLPLPSPLSADLAVRQIDPGKDVDGFHPANRAVVPPPVAAVLQLIKIAKPKRHAKVVILGKTSVLNKQLSDEIIELGHRSMIANARRVIPKITRVADVVVTSLGHGPRLGATHIKRGTIIIDVGIRKSRKKTVGDVAPSAWTKAGAVSPVPGGVGPLTVAYVLINTYQLAKRS